MQKSIYSLKYSTVMEPIFLGNVMAMSQVETNGRQSLSVKRILGMQHNPMAGILADPLINLSICDCLSKNQPSSHQNLNSFFWPSL